MPVDRTDAEVLKLEDELEKAYSRMENIIDCYESRVDWLMKDINYTLKTFEQSLQAIREQTLERP